MPVEKLITDGCNPIVEADGAVLSARTQDITIRFIDRSSLQTDLTAAPAALSTPTVPSAPTAPSALPELSVPPEHAVPPDKAVEDFCREDQVLFEMQAEGVYTYENLIRMPAKVTVSEMKRRAPPPEDDEDLRDYKLPERSGTESGTKDLAQTGRKASAQTGENTGSEFGDEAMARRPINLILRAGARKRKDKLELTPTENGILLHSVFQYLDFSSLPEPASPDDVRTELERMIRYHMIRPDQLTYVEKYLPDIAAFSSSDICRRMKTAERTPGRGPFREIPFSITEPVSPEDFLLIQGMIDCWFIEDGGAVLVDYKSDRIRGDRAEKERILKERYSVQIDYYARAIEAASRLKVTEKMIWLIPDATSFAF
jgi:ATP-dependent exoDNAse (exonuclease V) beta subunit